MPSRKTSSKSSTKAKHTNAFSAAAEDYGRAMKLLVHQRDFAGAAEALEGFLKEYEQADGILELIDRARTHLAACRQKIDPPAAEPETGAAWLTEAVVLSNEGQTDGALQAFEKALAGGAESAKVYYARAAALAVADRSDEAIESLRLAIEADPENRAFALGDPDFERLRELAGFVELVEPPRSGGGGPEEVTGHEPDIREIPDF